MHGLEGERTLMRVHVEEQHKFEGRPVYEVVVELLRHHHMAGAIAFRATSGFGASAHIHAEHVWELKLDVPVIIECVDTDDKIQAVLPELDRVIGSGVITLERAHVILYRKERSRTSWWGRRS